MNQENKPDPSKANKLDSLITKYACSEYQHVANEPQFDCEMVEFQRPDLYKLLNEYASQHSYTEQKWVNVKDRLPENRHWVLVMSNSELFLANYKHGLFYNGLEVLYKPTHWMLLPKPPTEQ